MQSISNIPINEDAGQGEDLRAAFKSVLSLQVLITLVAAGAFAWFGGRGDMLAALYGGACAATTATWLAWRVRRLSARIGAGDKIGMTTLAGGMLPRLVFVAAAFGAGIGWLELSAMPLALVFGLNYFAYVASLRSRAVSGPGKLAEKAAQKPEGEDR